MATSELLAWGGAPASSEGEGQGAVKEPFKELRAKVKVQLARSLHSSLRGVLNLKKLVHQWMDDGPEQDDDAEEDGEDGAAESERVYSDVPEMCPIQLRGACMHGNMEMRRAVWLEWSAGCGTGMEAAYPQLLAQELPTTVAADIAKDCHRTFPTYRRFAGPEGQASLSNVLHAYAAHNEQVAYCQGMNFVAGCLLMFLPKEPEAFRVLATLMSERGLAGLYGASMPLLQAQLWQLGRLLPQELAAHLEGCGVVPVHFAASWLMTCFAADFPISVAARVVDVLLNGSCHAALLKVALALLQQVAGELLGMQDMEDILGFLKTTLPGWPEPRLHEVLQQAFTTPWSTAQLEVLHSTEGQESVAQSMERVARMAAAHPSDSTATCMPAPQQGSGSLDVGGDEHAAAPQPPQLELLLQGSDQLAPGTTAHCSLSRELGSLACDAELEVPASSSNLQSALHFEVPTTPDAAAAGPWEVAQRNHGIIEGDGTDAASGAAVSTPAAAPVPHGMMAGEAAVADMPAGTSAQHAELSDARLQQQQGADEEGAEELVGEAAPGCGAVEAAVARHQQDQPRQLLLPTMVEPEPDAHAVPPHVVVPGLQRHPSLPQPQLQEEEQADEAEALEAGDVQPDGLVCQQEEVQAGSKRQPSAEPQLHDRAGGCLQTAMCEDTMPAHKQPQEPLAATQRSAALEPGPTAAPAPSPPAASAATPAVCTAAELGEAACGAEQGAAACGAGLQQPIELDWNDPRLIPDPQLLEAPPPAPALPPPTHPAPDPATCSPLTSRASAGAPLAPSKPLSLLQAFSSSPMPMAAPLPQPPPHLQLQPAASSALPVAQSPFSCFLQQCMVPPPHSQLDEADAIYQHLVGSGPGPSPTGSVRWARPHALHLHLQLQQGEPSLPCSQGGASGLELLLPQGEQLLQGRSTCSSCLMDGACEPGSARLPLQRRASSGRWSIASDGTLTRASSMHMARHAGSSSDDDENDDMHDGGGGHDVTVSSAWRGGHGSGAPSMAAVASGGGSVQPGGDAANELLLAGEILRALCQHARQEEDRFQSSGRGAAGTSPAVKHRRSTSVSGGGLAPAASAAVQSHGTPVATHTSSISANCTLQQPFRLSAMLGNLGDAAAAQQPTQGLSLPQQLHAAGTGPGSGGMSPPGGYGPPPRIALRTAPTSGYASPTQPPQAARAARVHSASCARTPQQPLSRTGSTPLAAHASGGDPHGHLHPHGHLQPHGCTSSPHLAGPGHQPRTLLSILSSKLRMVLLDEHPMRAPAPTPARSSCDGGHGLPAEHAAQHASGMDGLEAGQCMSPAAHATHTHTRHSAQGHPPLPPAYRHHHEGLHRGSDGLAILGGAAADEEWGAGFPSPARRSPMARHSAGPSCPWQHSHAPLTQQGSVGSGAGSNGGAERVSGPFASRQLQAHLVHDFPHATTAATLPAGQGHLS